MKTSGRRGLPGEPDAAPRRIVPLRWNHAESCYRRRSQFTNSRTGSDFQRSHSLRVNLDAGVRNLLAWIGGILWPYRSCHFCVVRVFIRERSSRPILIEPFLKSEKILQDGTPMRMIFVE